MTKIQFEKPEYKIVDYVESNFYGKFELEPLERGFGTTLGNALRRVLLSSLPGSAISSVKIDGIQHEFQTLEGIREDIVTIILNLKSVVIKNHTDEEKVMRIDITGKEDETVIKAGDIIHDADIEILNPDLEICTVCKGGHLAIEMNVSNGRGYVRSEENKKLLDASNKKVGLIAIDSLYSPIERVSYEVDSARVGQNENYDKLTLNVWTNGSMKPEEAVALASQILIEHFEILTRLSDITDKTGMMKEKAEDTTAKALDTSIDELDFSVRAYNCLKRANIHTVGDLIKMSENEIMKIRNLGKKSYQEVINKIKELGLELRED